MRGHSFGFFVDGVEEEGVGVLDDERHGVDLRKSRPPRGEEMEEVVGDKEDRGLEEGMFPWKKIRAAKNGW